MDTDSSALKSKLRPEQSTEIIEYALTLFKLGSFEKVIKFVQKIEGNKNFLTRMDQKVLKLL